MDASTYLRRKKESMTQYIHKPAFMDAGTRTELLGRAAGSAHYVSPNVKPAAIATCLTSKPAFTGSATAEPVKVAAPGCCSAADANSITIPCCTMIYEPSSTIPVCKVQPYVGTRIQHSEAVASHVCG